MSTPRTKKVKTINKKTLVVAVDIGKNFHHGYFRTPDNQEVKPFRFYNSGHSFKGFWDKICRFLQKQGLQEIIVGFESTGCYAEPLLHFLREKPVTLVQVNPLHSKRLKELSGNSPNKTDKKDPRVIADIISLGHALTVVVCEGSAAHLRRLTQARERALKTRNAMYNQLHDLVFLIFPEFLRIMKKLSTTTARYLIKHYPSPESIAALGLQQLTAVMRKVSRGKLDAQRAQALYKAAENSIGVSSGQKSMLLEIKHLLQGIEHQNQFIAAAENQLADYLKQIPYSQNILSIKGIGPVTVAGLIGEVGDFRKYQTLSEITKLAGLDLFEISSGKHQGQRHISKRGRALIRKLLFYAAINTVRTNGIMNQRYQKLLARGTPKVKALVAISRKLLRIIFALVRDNALYVETDQYQLAA